MKILHALAALSAGFLCIDPARAASDSDFPNCDGYAAPKGKSDGISRETWLYGAASRSADIRRDDMTRFGATGLQACDLALKDPRLVDQFWLRKASLLQAKAVHALANGDKTLAIELAAQSDAAGGENVYFRRSLGLGNEAVRAYAAILLGQRENANRSIERLRAERGWSPTMSDLASKLHTLQDQGLPTYMEELRAGVPLIPIKSLQLFWMRFVDGDYAGASAIAPAISFDFPKQRGGWSIATDESLQLKSLEERADIAGAWAYAEMVAGNPARAEALLADAASDLEEALAPPQPQADGRPPRKKDVAAHAIRVPYAERGKAQLEKWRRTVAFRAKMKDFTPAEFDAATQAQNIVEMPILPDIAAFVSVRDPASKRGFDQVLANYRKHMSDELARTVRITVPDLMSMLPRPETAEAIPVLKSAGDGYFLSDSGLSRAQEGNSDIWTIRYTHNIAPMVATEELVMLGAAQTARKQGFDSFLIVSRRSMTRTTHMSGWGGPIGDFNSGYEAQLRVRFVNAAALPGDLQPMAWRVIAAQKVIDDLSARYTQSKGITIAF